MIGGCDAAAFYRAPLNAAGSSLRLDRGGLTFFEGHRGGEPHVEHEIDEHAGDADVKPNRPSDAGDFFMAGVIAFQSSEEGDQSERHDGHGEQNMGDEHGVVGGADRSFSAKRSMDAAHADLMSHVKNEEDAGNTESGQHGGAVGRNAALFNKDEGNDQKHGREPVERGIQRRKVMDGHETNEMGGSGA